MQAKVIGRLTARTRRSLIAAARNAFLIDAAMSSFAGQPVSMLIAPTATVPASVHFMYFPPGLKQPLHNHPGDRQLLCVMGSKMRVIHAAQENPNEDDFSSVSFEPGDVGTLVIPTATWHLFEVDLSGDGA